MLNKFEPVRPYVPKEYLKPDPDEGDQTTQYLKKLVKARKQEDKYQFMGESVPGIGKAVLSEQKVEGSAFKDNGQMLYF